LKTFGDTNVFIYLIEEHPTFLPRVLALYERHLANGDTLITSFLTLGELLVVPLRLGNHEKIQQYLGLLTESERIHLVAFDRSAVEHYARIRAFASIRQPDAIQLACAVAAGATTFITNDQRLWELKVAGIDTICGL